jgi:hypothetical protein
VPFRVSISRTGVTGVYNEPDPATADTSASFDATLAQPAVPVALAFVLPVG